MLYILFLRSCAQRIESLWIQVCPENRFIAECTTIMPCFIYIGTTFVKENQRFNDFILFCLTPCFAFFYNIISISFTCMYYPFLYLKPSLQLTILLIAARLLVTPIVSLIYLKSADGRITSKPSAGNAAFCLVYAFQGDIFGFGLLS